MFNSAGWPFLDGVKPQPCTTMTVSLSCLSICSLSWPCGWRLWWLTLSMEPKKENSFFVIVLCLSAFPTQFDVGIFTFTQCVGVMQLVFLHSNSRIYSSKGHKYLWGKVSISDSFGIHAFQESSEKELFQPWYKWEWREK